MAGNQNTYHRYAASTDAHLRAVARGVPSDQVRHLHAGHGNLTVAENVGVERCQRLHADAHQRHPELIAGPSTSTDAPRVVPVG